MIVWLRTRTGKAHRVHCWPDQGLSITTRCGQTHWLPHVEILRHVPKLHRCRKCEREGKREM